MISREEFRNLIDKQLEEARVRGDEQSKLITEKLVPLFQDRREEIVTSINDALKRYLEDFDHQVLPRPKENAPFVCGGPEYRVVLEIALPLDPQIDYGASMFWEQIFELALLPVLKSDEGFRSWRVYYDGIKEPSVESILYGKSASINFAGGSWFGGSAVTKKIGLIFK